MNDQQKTDIIRSILNHPEWEPSYLLELINQIQKVNGGISLKENEAIYVLKPSKYFSKPDEYLQINDAPNNEWVVMIDAKNKTLELRDST